MSVEYEDPEELALQMREAKPVDRDPDEPVHFDDEVLPIDASAADVLEQRQEVADDDDHLAAGAA